MMVNTKKMHHNYINDLRNQIKDLCENIEKNEINITKSIKKLIDILNIKSKQKLNGLFKTKLANLYSSSQELRYVKLLFNMS